MGSADNPPCPSAMRSMWSGPSRSLKATLTSAVWADAASATSSNSAAIHAENQPWLAAGRGLPALPDEGTGDFASLMQPCLGRALPTGLSRTKHAALGRVGRYRILKEVLRSHDGRRS